MCLNGDTSVGWRCVVSAGGCAARLSRTAVELDVRADCTVSPCACDCHRDVITGASARNVRASVTSDDDELVASDVTGTVVEEVESAATA